MWTNKGRQWERLVPRLRDRLPLFVLGPYAQAARLRGRGQRVEAKAPFDLLGVYVLMPALLA